MKNILFFLLLISIASCSSEDEIVGVELDGKWEMTSFIAYVGNSPLNSNDIEWTFDVENDQLTIVNNVELKYSYILESGIYNNLMITANTVTIKNVEYDYEIKNGKLVISDNPEVDGPSMSFIKD
jgi:hypothetical protein